MYQIFIKKEESESSRSVFRRFSTHARSLGIVKTVRGLKFEKRIPSRNVKKKQRLQAFEKQEAYRKLVRLGKIPENRNYK